MQEIKVMKCLGHENTVRFFTAFHDKSVSYLVLEICGGGGTNTFKFFSMLRWALDC